MIYSTRKEGAIVAKIGDRIKIISMPSTNLYDGLEGTVEDINYFGYLKGTWGDIAVVPGHDEYEIINLIIAEKVYLS